MAVYRRELTIQMFVDRAFEEPKDDNTPRTRTNAKVRQSKAGPSLDLCCVLYGPSAFFEPVGLFTAKCNLFLQHPKHCNRRVLYRNPHCLSRDESDDLYTQELDSVLGIETTEESQVSYNPIDFFADTAEQGMLLDTDSPWALCTPLYKHQKQALTFMIQRERGWTVTGERKDIWKAETDEAGRVFYFNTVSGQKQMRPPKTFRGGLLTDAPGLGKSLSIIALIATTNARVEHGINGDNVLAATLLVVPKTRKYWNQLPQSCG